MEAQGAWFKKKKKGKNIFFTAASSERAACHVLKKQETQHMNRQLTVFLNLLSACKCDTCCYTKRLS